MARKKTTDTPATTSTRTPRARKPRTRTPRGSTGTDTTAAAPPPPVVQQHPPNVVLCGFQRVGVKIREFARPSRVAHGNERTVTVDGRLYEYTGTDADGRRVYRDHTRLT